MTDRQYLRLMLVALLVGTGSSCANSEPNRSACAIGSQGCPCTDGLGCDPGLACATGTCTPKSDEAKQPEAATLELPTTGKDEPLPATLVVSCTKDGHVYVGDRSVDDDDELRRVLAEKAQAAPNLRAIIQCDGDAPFARVVELIDMLQSAGVRNYAIATAPPNR